MTLVDDQRLDSNNMPLNYASNSGKVCLSLKTIPGDTTQAIEGASVCFNLDDSSLTLRNTNDFDNPYSIINSLKLTEEIDKVTINGNPIWHKGNLESSGKSIYFLGMFNAPDETHYPELRLDNSQLQPGDVFYNEYDNLFYYWAQNKWLGVGKRLKPTQYEFSIEDENKVQFDCVYNPDYVMVFLSGILLSHSAYEAIDGETIVLSNQAKEGDILNIQTIIEEQIL
jgi:hypothetical protein